MSATDKDPDIELLAGQVWNAPVSPRQAKERALLALAENMAMFSSSPTPIELAREDERMRNWIWYSGDQWHEEDIEAMRAHIARQPWVFNRISFDPESMRVRSEFIPMSDVFKQQAEIVRRAPLSEQSENDHEPPYFGYLLPKKGGEG